MLAKVRQVMSPRGQPPPSSAASTTTTSDTPKVGMVVDMSDTHLIGGLIPVITGGDKQPHPYTRPDFLFLTNEEISLSGDQSVRPVICPKYPLQMPVYAGYAEVINTGKSAENEDMATAKIMNIVQQGYEAEKAVELEDFVKLKREKKIERQQSDEELLTVSLSFSSDDGPVAPRCDAAYFGLFDGHAGSGAAMLASNCLHEHIKSRLSEVLESVLHLNRQEQLSTLTNQYRPAYENGRPKAVITSDVLVIGALEAAFLEMDNQIAEEKTMVKIPGGCAAIAALFLLGKIYVANAGDCRAILVTSDAIHPLSNDFNPIHERKRLQAISYRLNDIISPHFSRLEYSRCLTSKDLNRKVLFRDWYMEGWAAKTVRDSDLKQPLISTRTRKPRLLNTIGVTRGFGDHHLMTADDKISIKPFLSPFPEVKIFDVRSLDSLTDKDVVVMASDGLWDVLTNEDVAQIVRQSLNNADHTDFSKYTLLAQELVAAARGEQVGQFKWKLSNGDMASTDDISVFVIPLKFAVNLPKTEDDDEELLS